MTREEILNVLEGADWKAGEVFCDISRNGQVCYPNERIIVKLNGYSGFIELESGTFWTICDDLNDFKDNVVVGEEEARKTYCRYYVSEFNSVREFKV